MLTLKLSELREGMVFSKPLMNEDGEILLRPNSPLTKVHISNFVLKGLYEVHTFGEILSGGEHQLKILRRSQIQLLKERLKKEIQEEKTLNNVTIAQKQEMKLDRIEVVEQSIESYSKILSVFNKVRNRNLAFIEKLSTIIKLLITEIEEDYFSFLDVISNTNFGFHFASHSIKTAIHSIYISHKVGMKVKRIYKIGLGALLHDIGKIAYHKINELEGINPTKEQMNLNVSHPVYGYRIAKQILKLPEEICQIIINHHEQLNGKGFPRKVNSFRISEGDHIVFISNFFENLIAKSNYEGYKKSIEQIRMINDKYKGIFEDKIIKVLIELKER